jgi:serine/threonine protein kinase
VFAKPGYVAPEVANGDSGDFRVDLYALGVMLWELCAGRRFLEGEASDHLAAVAAGKRDLPPIAESVGAPLELDTVIARLTAHDRDARYGSSRDAARDLAALLIGAPSMEGGERGVRGRVASLLLRLFPGETSRFRREFQRLVDDARRKLALAEAAAARSIEAASDTPLDPPADSTVAAEPAPEAPVDVQAGVLPGTRWRLLREIGRGASSVVWEAEHADLGTRAAVKVHPGGEGGRSRFRVEARALARVKAPVVEALSEAGMASDGRPFTVLELLDGVTLDRWVERRSPLDVTGALSVAVQILTALEGIHAAALVHRDLKPENVFCCADGSIRILDLGIARDLTPGAEEDPPSGGALALHGTPAYMAPEQASGVADERSDVYAVGCILYEMLAGSLPFAGDAEVGSLSAKAKGSPEPLRERVAARDVPAEVDDLVLRALARHPSVRFATARAMREAIEKVQSAPNRLRARRRRMGFAALAGAMLLGAGLLALPRIPFTASLVERLRAPEPAAAAVVAEPTGLEALSDAVMLDAPGDPLADLPAEVALLERELQAEEEAELNGAPPEVASGFGDEFDQGSPPAAEEAEPPRPRRKKRRDAARTEDAPRSKNAGGRGDRAARGDKPSKSGDRRGKGSDKAEGPAKRSKKKGKGRDRAAEG